MKGDFIIKFLGEITMTVQDFNREASQLSCRGFRPSRFNVSRNDRRKYYSGLKNLEQRKIIQNVNSDYYRFTSRGQSWLNRSMLKYFKIRHGKWDKKWRVVIFDIPRELDKERGKFRRKLRWLGFAMLQESVFVFPYPCEEEISDLTRDLGVGDYVDVITAESIGFKEKEFSTIFNLR